MPSRVLHLSALLRKNKRNKAYLCGHRVEPNCSGEWLCADFFDMDIIEKGQELIAADDPHAAIALLKPALSESPPAEKARIHYLIGNAYRKELNWQQAIQHYLESMELDSSSPAREAYRMVMDILNFYNKDMFNQ